jgi:hypothetical protein
LVQYIGSFLEVLLRIYRSDSVHGNSVREAASTCAGTLPDLQTVDFWLPICSGILIGSGHLENFLCRIWWCSSKSLEICIRALPTASATDGRRSGIIVNEVEVDNLIQISRVFVV